MDDKKQKAQETQIFRKTRSLKEEDAAHRQTQRQRREERRKRRFRRVLRLTAALAFLAASAALTLFSIGPVRRSNLADAAALFGRRGEGFPLPYSYGNVLQAALLGGELVLLSPTALELYTASAYQTLRLPQPYDSPALEICNGRAVLFDRSSSRLQLFSRTKLLYEKTLDEKPFCVDLNRRGDVAAATKADTSTSKVFVWDAKQTQRFAWECENEYVGALSLSSNGKRLAMCLIGTEKAGVYSRFVLYSVGKDKPSIDLRFQDAWLYRVSPIRGGWMVPGDQAIYLIRENGSYETLSFGGHSLIFSDAEENGLSAVLLQDWNKNGSLLRVYSNKGALLQEVALREQVSALRVEQGKVYLRLEDILLCRKPNGSFVQSQPLPTGSQEVFVRSNTIYALTVGSVEQLEAQWKDYVFTE